MEFSIIYLTYRPGGFDILADSLANQTNQDYELIVVDNYASELKHPDRSSQVKKYLEDKGVKLSYLGPSKPKCFPELPSGVMNAMNTGLLLSTKEAVIILTDYIWLPPDWLERISKHADILKQGHCVVLGGQFWEVDKPRNNEGAISIWKNEWREGPERNGGRHSFFWMPEAWEFSCTAMPWDLVKAVNGFPEYLDAKMAHPLDPIVNMLEAAGGKPYVDRENLTHLIDHREWHPAELWHQAKRRRKQLSVIPRENCFNLKTHTRGKAYWPIRIETQDVDVFNKPEYWSGDLGYRPGPDGIGYRDFPVNRIRADYLMSKAGRVKILDIGCAMGYLVKRLRDRGADAWGIDISKYAISHAPYDVKPYLKVGSADKLPWGDKEFDLVVSFSVFEHLPESIVQGAISEVIRVGKQGIISVTPGDNPHFDEDITHQTKQPLAWWRQQFPPEFEIRSDTDEEWQKVVPDISAIPIVQMARPDWIRGKVTMQDLILEVGCAENPVWKETAFKVTTVDKQVNPQLQIFPDCKAEAEELPFKEGEYDVVCEGELLEHVADPQRVLREAARVAKKKIILTVPFEWAWTDDLKPFWNPGHVRFYTPESLGEELKALGLPFKIELIRNGPWVWLGAEVYKESNISTDNVTVSNVMTSDSNVAAGEAVKLNLGSFVDTIGYGWVNIDILAVQQHIPRDHKFRQWDLRQGIPYPDSSVDLVRASHLIEHLTLEEVHSLCREIYRVLKPGGFARILTPDARLIIKHYLNNDMAFFNAIQPSEYILAPTEGEKLSRILFSGDYQHRAVYDFGMLKSFLNQAGFESGKVYLVGAGFSWSPVMQNEAMDQHIEISLIVEAMK
jgi:ubiquinone/menaquinone biosynthesis C-methylase UbiE/glycosyltransferase involved in cell wall biosynthesis